MANQNTSGGSSLEKRIYLAALGGFVLLGVAVAVTALLGQTTLSLTFVGCATALVGPMAFLHSRRALRNQKAALRQMLRGSATKVSAQSPGGAPAQFSQEILSLLTRNDRHLSVLRERLGDTHPGVAPVAGDTDAIDRLATELANLGGQLSKLREEQAALEKTVHAGWSDARADINAALVAIVPADERALHRPEGR